MGYLTQVKESCAALVESSSLVSVNHDAIRAFLKDLDRDEFLKMSEVVKWPLRFETLIDEINFVSIINLLNFASGYRQLLHEKCDRGAYETIQYGVISLHLAGTPLDSNFMRSTTVADLAQAFSLPIYQERQIRPGLIMEEPTELKNLVDQIAGVLHETGRILAEHRIPSLAHFILHTLSHSGQPQPKAELLVEALANAFPAFRDIHEIRGQQVYLLKKAQLLAADLHRNLGAKEKLFQFPDIAQLTVFSDNVLPAVLRELKIIRVEEKLLERIEKGDFLNASEGTDTELRAAAILASEEIVKLARSPEFAPLGLGEVNSMVLDYYLWKVGKEPRFRKVQRHATKDTIFY